MMKEDCMDILELTKITRDAVKKGYLDPADRTAILADPGAYGDAILQIQDKMRGETFLGKIGGALSSVGRQVKIGGSSFPIWIVVLVVFAIATSGVDKVVNLIVPKPADFQETAGAAQKAISVNQENWIRIADNVVLPVNKLPFPKVPLQGSDTRTVVAVILLLVNLLPAISDNLTARPKQTDARVSNWGMLFFFLGMLLWGYWSVILAAFGALLCRRDRSGNLPSFGTSFVLLALGLWLWFDRLSPIVAKWLDANLATNPNLVWITNLLTWLINGDNARPLGLLVLIGVLVWSVASHKHDSSTLIVVLGIVIAWRWSFGVWPYAENVVPAWLDLAMQWAMLAMMVIFALVEQAQNGIPAVSAGILIFFGLGYLISYAIRGIFGVKETDTTVWRWVTQPLVFCYALVLFITWLFGRAISGKSKTFDTLYKVLQGWMGFLVTVGPFELPADAIYLMNSVLAAVLVMTNVKIL
jgi:hypothetical protein